MKFFRNGFFLALFLLSLFPASGFSQSEGLTLVCDEWPPYQMRRDGAVIGFSTTVVREVFQAMDMTPASIQAYPWKRALRMLRADRVDGLFSANFTEDRLRFARYPDETLIRSPWVIWGRTETGFAYDDLSDLAGKRIGVVNGYSYTPSFWKYIRKHAIVDGTTTDETNFRKLAAGRLDCLIAELGNGLFLHRTLGLDNVVPFPESPIKVDGLYLIFNRDRVSEETVARFSEALKVFKAGPAYSELHQKYFGAP